MKFDLSKIKKIDLAKAKNINFSKMKKPSVSKRELMMIGVLILALEGYVLFSSFLIPKWQQFSSVQKHYNILKAQAKNVENEYAKKAQYEEQLKLLDYRLAKLTKELPPYVSQEDIILTLNKFADDRKLKIDQIAFGEISSVSRQDFAAGKLPSGQGGSDGKGNTSSTAATSTKTAANAGKTAGQKPGEILIEEINLGFTGSYGALYNFMGDLEKSERKTSIQGITMNRGNGNTLKGQIRVLYVGNNISGNTDIYKLEAPKIEGKDGPFTAYPGYDEKNVASAAVSAGSAASADSAQNAAGPVPVKAYDPNFYLILNTYDDNAPKIIIGDSSRDGTELYSNTNASVKGKLSISGNQDNMTYSYSLGGTTQTKSAKLSIDGGKLRLEVSSLPRKNEKDKVSVTLDVENKTDYPLEIAVINDDKQAPRFSIGTRLGSVTVK